MPEWKAITADEPNAMWFRDEGCQCIKDEPSKVVELITDAYLKKTK